MATPITELGVRATFKRMLDDMDRRSYSMYRFRQDGTEIQVFMLRDANDMFEIRASWQANDHNEEFVMAMNRLYEPVSLSIRLATVRRNFAYSTNDSDAIPDITLKLTTMMVLELCACRKCMISDGELVCYTCMLGIVEEDMRQHVCGICYETCIAPIKKQSCCGQFLHRACSIKSGPVCPFCRGEPTT